MKLRRSRSLREIFFAPVLIFFLTLVGLVSSLLTQGTADLLGVASTGSALVAIGWVLIRPAAKGFWNK